MAILLWFATSVGRAAEEPRPPYPPSPVIRRIEWDAPETIRRGAPDEADLAGAFARIVDLLPDEISVTLQTLGDTLSVRRDGKSMAYFTAGTVPLVAIGAGRPSAEDRSATWSKSQHRVCDWNELPSAAASRFRET